MKYRKLVIILKLVDFVSISGFFDYWRKFYAYGRTRPDGYVTKKMGIFALLYVPVVDCSTKFYVFS